MWEAVKAVNEVLGALRLEKHPDKTFIGRIEKGFDFLGYHFSRTGLTVAEATIERFVERATRLYEQDRKEPSGPSRLGGSDDLPIGIAIRIARNPDRGGMELLSTRGQFIGDFYGHQKIPYWIRWVDRIRRIEQYQIIEQIID